MAYTTINKSTDNFNTKLYTGNSGTQALTGVGFQPDWVWIKGRSTAYSHNIYDSVRGVTKIIKSNSDSSEDTQSTSLTAFGTDGFTLGSYDESNYNGRTYASWNWKAGGAGSANTAGSINSTVSVNQTAGFSIVSFVGNATSGATVGHGLNAVPKVVIIKGRDSDLEWRSYFSPIGAGKYMVLNETYAEATGSNFMNNTAPTSSVFSLGNGTTPNKNGENYIAYCFAEKTGYSKFGSYTGNGNSDGPFIFTGFKPAFVITKRTDAIGDWQLRDSVRAMASDYPQTPPVLEPHSGNTESSIGGWNFDFLSNGFKQRETNVTVNASGGSYIYMAFASAPLVGTNNVPCTAR